MTTRMPVLFVSHGAPTFAIDPGIAGPRLTALGQELPKPTAVLVVSPHWMTRGGAMVGNAEHPETIHDFGGFPPRLYQLQYPAPGAPSLAQRTLQHLRNAGLAASNPLSARGLDHGAWVPLMYLLPEAQVPVFQVSLPYPLDAAGALRLGQALAPLRDEGVLIVASGSLTHNLYEFRVGHADQADYVREFAGWVGAALVRGDRTALLDYRQQAPDAQRAHPTEEHFLPLLVALGASHEQEDLRIIEGGIAHGVLAMDAYAFGLPAQAA